MYYFYHQPNDRYEQPRLDKRKVAFAGVVLFLFVMTILDESGDRGNHSGGDIRIGAFNIQTFGKKKMTNQEVVDQLVKIILRYDILLIQEIRDASGVAIKGLLKQVNQASPVLYRMVISPRLGRTRSKEQYAYFYKDTGQFSVVQVYQDPDPGDLFEREPFSVQFAFTSSALPKLTLMGVHVDPDDVVAELNALVSAHERAVHALRSDNVMIMGDFNAGGKYLSQSKLLSLKLRQDGFVWLLPEGIDTSVAASHRPYDRLVATGEEFLHALKKNSAGVFRFDDEFGLRMEEAQRVSDHYPVSVSLSAIALYGDDVAKTPVTSEDEPQVEEEDFLDRVLRMLGSLCICCGNRRR